MRNTTKIAKRIVSESEGAGREREIHELNQQFDAPAYKDDGSRMTDQGTYERADQAHVDAIEAVHSLLDNSPFGNVLKSAWESDADVLGFCQAVAVGMSGGPLKMWFLELAHLLELESDTGREVNSASDRLPNKFRPQAVRIVGRLVAVCTCEEREAPAQCQGCGRQTP